MPASSVNHISQSISRRHVNTSVTFISNPFRRPTCHPRNSVRLPAQWPTPSLVSRLRQHQPALATRSKSTHHPLPSRLSHNSQESSSSNLVLPKPSLPSSVAPPDHQPLSPSPSPPQPPPQSNGPPRLIRYQSHSVYPPSYSHSAFPDPTSYRAHLSSRRAPASLFSFFPSATAASIAQPSSIFADNPSSINSSKDSSPALTEATVPASNPTVKATSLAGTMSKSSSISVSDTSAAVKRNSANGQAKHDHDDQHSHSHGVAGWLGGGHSHSHSHAHEGSVEEADKLLAALKGKGDRGSNITVAGLVANLGLCGTKGVAGLYLNSAALLADAAHSLSDMFSDLVTLFCWKMSQKPPSETHPLGYGKYETMGSLGVSLVLVAGALGIGFHSYGLLLEALQPTMQNAPAAIQAFGSFTGSIASAGSHLHEHHDPGSASSGGNGLLDPNAMWFALLSIVVKEWLYHATLKIAKEENSSVLEANALHHRSDSLSSAVTFLAIGGSWLGFPVLDPLGGLLVAGLIGKQGADLLIGALGELSDRGVEPAVLNSFDKAIEKVQKQLYPDLLVGWKDLRAVKSGVSTFADVTLQLPKDTRLEQAREVEASVRKFITEAQKGVKEVRVRLDVVESADSEKR
ncbi:hypothetical protein IE53DRAFT_386781 [Violaceomyces palustris]|uniref:Uncharacterized protein n=1 Tax=Violaceomyces palustris TaxID=1673888 RepID=A0ACD0NYJ3_9BASI|nr:hypothetical protein IE53DRAFT_386781 [Violaceomyces palustris]